SHDRHRRALLGGEWLRLVHSQLLPPCTLPLHVKYSVAVHTHPILSTCLRSPSTHDHQHSRAPSWRAGWASRNRRRPSADLSPVSSGTHRWLPRSGHFFHHLRFFDCNPTHPRMAS